MFTSYRSYFQEFTYGKGFLYIVAITYVLCTAVVVTIEPILPLPCTYSIPKGGGGGDQSSSELVFKNPLYRYSPCKSRTRYARLLGLTSDECLYGRRLVASVVLGGVVGYERRTADRPAGIRTMCLVALASCLFTLNSMYALRIGPMSWDASRIAAAIPSGVGFLGAGLIVKHSRRDDFGKMHQVVQGLNTAASVWLSAGLGVACGGGLYFAGIFTGALIVVILRFGPRPKGGQDRRHSILGVGLPHSAPATVDRSFLFD